MFYTIYKVTNKINGKIYIGKHQTKKLDDGYMGSGKYITRAIQKYGLENFEKEILFVFETEAEMNNKEKEIVTKDFVSEDTNYNLCPGGNGGFGYLNDSSDKHIKRASDAGKKAGPATVKSNMEKYGVKSSFSRKDVRKRTDEIKRSKYGGVGFDIGNRSTDAKIAFKEKYGVDNPSQHPEIKERIKETFKKNKHGQGTNNSQYGTMWITNGVENKKIKKEDTIPEQWKKGRVNTKNYFVDP